MRGSDVSFYADRDELLELFAEFNAIGALAYTETLSAVNTPLLVFDDATQLIGSLWTQTQEVDRPKLFLVHGRASPLIVEDRVQVDGGGKKLSVCNLFNPNAIVIRLGGELDQDKTLVATSINTTGESEFSRLLFARFKKLVRGSARRVGRFYLLPNALTKWCGGWRLTPDPQYTATEDLPLPTEEEIRK